MENSTPKTKKSLLWRILRWGLIGLAGLLTLVALLWVEENWRGKWAWENYRREWEAKGEKFDLKVLVPPAVPDEENFTMTPFLAPLYDLKPDRKPGNSPWRDTNAHHRLEVYAEDLGSPKAGGGWPNAQPMDLSAWAVALDGQKDVPPSGESPSQRAAAAEVILQKMGRYEPVLEELRTASRRPYSRFNINYFDDNPEALLLPHLSLVKKLSMLYRLRAAAELAAGRNPQAIADVNMDWHLADSLKSEPILISGLVRVAIMNLTLQTIWEGLANHQWTDAQLQELQQQLEKMDFLKACEDTLRGERAFGNAVVDYQRRQKHIQYASDDGSTREGTLNLMPGGWYYQNQLTVNQMYQQLLLPPLDAAKHRIYLNSYTNSAERLIQELNQRMSFYTIYAKMLLPAIMKTEQKFAYAQVSIEEAALACALERYRLAHGQFPETLAVLSPQFIARVPLDLVTGEPLKYRRTNDGQFILYSVGWNGTDDGGAVAFRKGSTSSVDITQGDWVWKYPRK